jgi:pimeloyl-ACP methyl ester carboxylesterase
MMPRAGQRDLQHADAHQRVDATGKTYYRRARLEAWHAEAEISTIGAETLLIWGRLDGIVPLQYGEALRAVLPRAKLDVIDRCGHLPMVEKPETFHRLLYDFLVGVEEELPDVVKV